MDSSAARAGDAERRGLLVFSGGQATSLGGVNKALLEVGGKPIIQRILDALDRS